MVRVDLWLALEGAVWAGGELLGVLRPVNERASVFVDNDDVPAVFEQLRHGPPLEAPDLQAAAVVEDGEVNNEP